MAKRVNKNKQEIASDMMLARDAERRRLLISETIFPYLIDLNDSIGYTKIFLQAFSGLVEGVYENTRKSMTIGQLKDEINLKLTNIFKLSDPFQKKEYDRYVNLLNKLDDVPVQDLAYAAELPRYIDGYNTKNKDKESISNIDIKTILG